MSSIALCIPAFNAAKYLPLLLTSANEQSIKFDEILVYNDCSTDDTEAVAKAYGATVINGKINSGCSVGKNILAEVAKSEWLHFHDADDLLLPNFNIVAQKWINKDPVADVIILHYQYIDFETKEFLGEPKYNIDELYNDSIRFMIENKVVNFALINKKSFLKIGGFDTDQSILYNEDRAFYTRAAIGKLTFDYELETTCINYRRNNSMSSQYTSKCALAAYNVWQKVIDSTGDKYSKEISFQLMHNANYAAVAKDWSTLKMSVIKAKELYPNVLPTGSVHFLYLYRLFGIYAFHIREFLIINFTTKRNSNL